MNKICDEEEVSNGDDDDDDDDDDDGEKFIKNDSESESAPEDESQDEGDFEGINNLRSNPAFFESSENLVHLAGFFTNLFSSSAEVSASNASLMSFLHRNEITYDVAFSSTEMYILFLEGKNNFLLASIVRTGCVRNGRKSNGISCGQFKSIW